MPPRSRRGAVERRAGCTAGHVGCAPECECLPVDEIDRDRVVGFSTLLGAAGACARASWVGEGSPCGLCQERSRRHRLGARQMNPSTEKYSLLEEDTWLPGRATG